MIGHIVLVAVQFVVAFVGAPFLLGFIPVSGDPQIFVHAAIYAVIVWIVGLVGCFVLKDVRTPTSRTLVSALFGAMIGAALMLLPQLIDAIPFKFPPLYLPLVGAIVGYQFRR